MSGLKELVLEIDELEAIRLADWEGLYQEQAAEQMKISRQTFGRIVSSARKKVAQALVEGMSIRIEGGDVQMPGLRSFRCFDCQHEWQVPFGTGRPEACPACAGNSFKRTDRLRRSGGEYSRRCGAGKVRDSM